MTLVERAGIGVLLKDAQGHSVWAVSTDLLEQERAGALPTDVRAQIEVFEHVVVEARIADDLGVTHCDPSPA